MLCFWADWTVTPKSSDQLHTEGHPDERVEADLRLVSVAELAPKVVVELLPTDLAIHEREQVQITDVMELCAVAEPAVESALTRDPGLITVSPVQIGGPCLCHPVLSPGRTGGHARRVGVSNASDRDDLNGVTPTRRPLTGPGFPSPASTHRRHGWHRIAEGLPGATAQGRSRLNPFAQEDLDRLGERTRVLVHREVRQAIQRSHAGLG